MSTYSPNPANVVLLMPFAGIDSAPLTADYSSPPKDAWVVSLPGVPALTSAQARGGYQRAGEFCTGAFVETDFYPALNFSGAWVVEFWVLVPRTAIARGEAQRPFLGAMVRGNNNARLQFYLGIEMPPTVRCWSNVGEHIYDGPTVIFDESLWDSWVHVAYQRGVDGLVSIFINGQFRGIGGNTQAPAYSQRITVNLSRTGGNDISTAALYLSDLRITCGEAFYPLSGFTPPAQGFLYEPPAVDTQRVAGTLIGYSSALPHDVLVVGVEGDCEGLARVVPGASGEYEAVWSGYAGRVVAIALPRQGVAWVPNADLAVGDVIYPSAGYAGHVYVVSAAGSSGLTEPDWPTEPLASVGVGTASAVCRVYPQPGCAGPVFPDVIPASP